MSIYIFYIDKLNLSFDIDGLPSNSVEIFKFGYTKEERAKDRADENYRKCKEILNLKWSNDIKSGRITNIDLKSKNIYIVKGCKNFVKNNIENILKKDLKNLTKKPLAYDGKYEEFIICDQHSQEIINKLIESLNNKNNIINELNKRYRIASSSNEINNLNFIEEDFLKISEEIRTTMIQEFIHQNNNTLLLFKPNKNCNDWEKDLVSRCMISVQKIDEKIVREHFILYRVNNITTNEPNGKYWIQNKCAHKNIQDAWKRNGYNENSQKAEWLKNKELCDMYKTPQITLHYLLYCLDGQIIDIDEKGNIL